jgi:hypothetical protein
MPVTYVAESNATDLTSGNSTTSLTIGIPSGTENNDLMLMVLFTNNAQTVTAPNGWTNVTTYTGYGTLYIRIMYRVAQPGDTSWTWTQSTGDLWSCMIQTYRRTYSVPGQVVSKGQNGSSTTITATGGMTAGTADMHVVWGCLDMTSTHTMSASGYTGTTQVTRSYKQIRHFYKPGTGSNETPVVTFTTAASGRSAGLVGVTIYFVGSAGAEGGLFFSNNF